MAAVAQETQDTLASIATAEADLLETAVAMREGALERSGLDARTFALVKLAALIALGAPPASYAWQIANGLEEGVEPEELLGVLIAVAPQVGGPRVIAAASEIMLGLGLSLPEDD